MARKKTVGSVEDERDEEVLQKSGTLPELLSITERSRVSIKHGILAMRLIGEEEKTAYQVIVAAYENDFELNGSSDSMSVTLTALYFVQLMRAVMARDFENAERLDRMIRSHMRELKATKRTREGEGTGGKGANVSPAEFATALIEKVREQQAAGKLPRTIDAAVIEATGKALP